MSRFESITIREVESADLETFYEHQLDPEAIRMAAFVCEDPKYKVAFDAHWEKIVNSSQITKRTIVAEGQVAGHISCYPQGENMEVTYWLGREFWGRGLATRALNRMLHLVVDRPIFVRAATDNIGSIRVLQKCGFKIIGKDVRLGEPDKSWPPRATVRGADPRRPCVRRQAHSRLADRAHRLRRAAPSAPAGRRRRRRRGRAARGRSRRARGRRRPRRAPGRRRGRRPHTPLRGPSP